LWQRFVAEIDRIAGMLESASPAGRRRSCADLERRTTLADIARLASRTTMTPLCLLFWAAQQRSIESWRRDNADPRHRTYWGPAGDRGRRHAYDGLRDGLRLPVDPARKLLSIGYSLGDNRLDSSCYDLLASEARLASLFAIAKGDATTRHWFRLGRTATPLGHGSALISWSGSMFEYLMPSLVMRAPAGSLLEQTSRLVVQRQQAYGEALDVPWGISESAYNARTRDHLPVFQFRRAGPGPQARLADNT
jgi:cyclic beta-1,2-glucan synthetase